MSRTVCVGYLGCRIANRIKAAGWLRYEPRSFNFGERTTTADCHGFFLARGTPPEILVPPTTLPLMNSVPRRVTGKRKTLASWFFLPLVLQLFRMYAWESGCSRFWKILVWNWTFSELEFFKLELIRKYANFHALRFLDAGFTVFGAYPLTICTLWALDPFHLKFEIFESWTFLIF